VRYHVSDSFLAHDITMIQFNVHATTDDFHHVRAYEMNDTQFKYKCKCKKGYHAHGNGGDPHSNRVEYRSSHCPHIKSEVAVHITDETARKLKSKRK
jgi:predicted SprT family Zn-dependent metalloprotease